jgi:hypothetical protein
LALNSAEEQNTADRFSLETQPELIGKLKQWLRNSVIRFNIGPFPRWKKRRKRSKSFGLILNHPGNGEKR